MTRKESLLNDDWKEDPDNPLIPYRMSDRLYIAAIGLKVNIILYIVGAIGVLVGTGMALRYL